MPLKLLSSGGGSVLLTANTTASDFTVNVPAVNGNMVTTADTGSITQAMLGAGVYAGYGPSFSVYQNAAQSLSTNTWTKAQYNVEEWDTANCYDNTTNYRFTPNVAGYYTFIFATAINSTNCNIGLALYKNGAQYKWPVYPFNSSGNVCGGTAAAYANGSTDYFEIYTYFSVGQNVYVSSSTTFFQGFLLRAA